MYPKLSPKLCKIWVWSLIVLRTISALSRERVSKIRIFSLSQKSPVFIKGTQVQIWNSPYMFVFIQKQSPENFTFLILRILELVFREESLFKK